MPNPFEDKTKREIKIAIGQITGDEPSKDDQAFNIALTFEGKNAWKFVERVMLDFKSKRTDKYHKIYRNQLSVILANLYETHSVQDYLFTYYSRNNNDYKESKRYNPNDLSFRPLKFLADSLEKHGWVDTSQWYYDKKNEENRWCSRMRPSKKLIKTFKEFKITPKCIYQKPVDCIRLKDSKERLVEYTDTPTTNSMRNKLFAYNNLLLKTRIKIKRNKNVNRYLEFHPVNFKNIEYYRVFNDSSFELGGRFYGAWWVTLSKDVRGNITLNGEKTIELDYSSIGIHLLYSQENLNYYDLNDNPLQGTMERLHFNGKIKSKTDYTEGLRDGLVETYFDNGAINNRYNFKNGKSEGLRETFYRSGKVRTRGNNINGQLDGVFESYYENGKLKRRSNFSNGKRVKISEGYHDNGELNFKYCYKDGEEIDMSYCEK